MLFRRTCFRISIAPFSERGNQSDDSLMFFHPGIQESQLAMARPKDLHLNAQLLKARRLLSSGDTPSAQAILAELFNSETDTFAIGGGRLSLMAGLMAGLMPGLMAGLMPGSMAGFMAYEKKGGLMAP